MPLWIWLLGLKWVTGVINGDLWWTPSPLPAPILSPDWVQAVMRWEIRRRDWLTTDTCHQIHNPHWWVRSNPKFRLPLRSAVPTSNQNLNSLKCWISSNRIEREQFQNETRLKELGADLSGDWSWQMEITLRQNVVTKKYPKLLVVIWHLSNTQATIQEFCCSRGSAIG